MMQELLTKGIGHTEFKDSPVGRIPKGWEVGLLISVCTKISDGIHGTPNYTDYSDYRFINGNNLKGGKIVIGDSSKYVTKEEYEIHKKDLGCNTILMSINGTIGNLAYYNGEVVMLGKSASYINVNPGSSKEFIYYSLDSERVKKYYELELTGSTISNLSLGSLKNTPIAFPSFGEQKEIATILKSMDDGVSLKSMKLSHVKSLKKALMQDLLTGKVRVKTD
jgi:type I restriction enzyme S subunit